MRCGSSRPMQAIFAKRTHLTHMNSRVWAELSAARWLRYGSTRAEFALLAPQTEEIQKLIRRPLAIGAMPKIRFLMRDIAVS